MTRLDTMLRMGAMAMLAVVFWLPAAHAGDEHGAAEEAKAVVHAATVCFDDMGVDAAFDRFTNDPAPEFPDRDLYSLCHG